MIEKIFEKLNKIPAWVGYVVLIVGCCISAVPTILGTDTLINELNEIIQSTGQLQYQISATPGFKWVMGVVTAIVNWLVVELVGQFIFSWAVSSRYTNRGKKYYLNSLRYSYAVIRVVYGLYSLLSVWAPNVFAYSAEAVLFVIRTVVITITFYGIRKECLNDKFVYNCYSRLYFIYFVYNGASWLLQLFTTVLSSPIDVAFSIYSAVMIVVVGLSALALYLIMFKKLKKEQEEARKIIILPPTSGGGDSEIFKGYGL